MTKRLLALVLGIAACSRGNSGARSTDSAAGDVADDPPTRVARLSSIEGTVSLQAPGSDAWTRPTQNYTLTTGDRLYADSNAHAELDLGTGAIRLDHGGDLTVANLTNDFTQLGLDQGALEASLYRYARDDSLELDTPNGALVPTEAGTYIVSIEPAGGGTVVDVERGELDATGPGLDETLRSGQIVRLVGTNPIQAVALDAAYAESQPAFADLDRWRASRDRYYTSTGYASRYVSPSSPGWEDLDDYGVWVTDDADAHVWCPTHVSTTWVPYRDGRWSWVEPWGWTWVSDQPWGYTPFHYGRWETVTSRDCSSSWAWVPGPVVSNPVWAPALVAFVDGAGLQLSEGPNVEAWFPLGPSEPFFPWYHYSDDYLRDVNATNLLEVHDVDGIIRDHDVRDIRRINRDNALTVVPSAAFSAGDPVQRHAINVKTELLPPVRIAAHPSVNPRSELLAGGAPVRGPRVAERPEMVVTRASSHGGAGRREVAGAPQNVGGVPVAAPPGARERPAPVIARNEPRGERAQSREANGEVGMPLARGGGERTPAPSPTTRAAAPRTLISRNAPPPARPSAAARESAMQAHPGRPLEPRQTENLREGRPAGAPRDHEIPGHRVAAPMPPQVRPQAPRAAPPPQRVAPVLPQPQRQQQARPPQPQARPRPPQTQPRPSQPQRPQPAARPQPPHQQAPPQGRGKPGGGRGRGGGDGSLED